METNEITLICGLILQFIGIMVGAGIILEFLFGSNLLRTLFVGMSRIMERSIFHSKGLNKEYDYKASLNELYEIVSNPKYLLGPMIIVPIQLMFSLGIWIFMIYRIWQLVVFGIEIEQFWIVTFIVLFVLLSLDYLFALPFQMILKKEITATTGVTAIIKKSFISNPSEWIIAYLKNWYEHPLNVLTVQVQLIIIGIFLMPAWILSPLYKIKLNSEKNRQRYFLTYATLALLISTSAQIIAIFL